MQMTFIGDIHSAADDLQVLLEALDQPHNRFIFIGDYIDGLPVQHFEAGQQARTLAPLAVLDLLMQRVQQHGDVALLGNHDDFWLGTAQGDAQAYATWRRNGGQTTWPLLGLPHDALQLAVALNQPPFKRYTDFLATLPLFWQNQHLLAVHAGINWQYPLNQQVRDDVLWLRDAYFYAPQQPTFHEAMAQNLDWPVYHPNDTHQVIVTGHTPVQTLNRDRTLLKMQHDPADTPRYLIDGGSRSGVATAGITALTLSETGTFLAACTVINGQLRPLTDR